MATAEGEEEEERSLRFCGLATFTEEQGDPAAHLDNCFLRLLTIAVVGKVH